MYAEQGRIDVVFANAGISKEAQLIETDRAKKGEKPIKPDLMTLNVNLVGVIYCEYFLCPCLSFLSSLSMDDGEKLTWMNSDETRNPLHLQKHCPYQLRHEHSK